MNLDHQEVLNLAGKAVEKTRDYASSQLGFDLPEACTHALGMHGFRGELYSIEEMVSLLTNGETFPLIVDLAIRGIYEGKTFVLWLPSGHAPSSFIDTTWNEGLGPFKPVGVMSPKAHFRLTRAELERLAADWVSGRGLGSGDEESDENEN